MNALQTDQLTLLEAFGLTTPRWVLPEVTAAALQTWREMGSPGDLWPIELYRDGVTPVEFAGPEELRAATVQPAYY